MLVISHQHLILEEEKGHSSEARFDLLSGDLIDRPENSKHWIIAEIYVNVRAILQKPHRSAWVLLRNGRARSSVYSESGRRLLVYPYSSHMPRHTLDPLHIINWHIKNSLCKEHARLEEDLEISSILIKKMLNNLQSLQSHCMKVQKSTSPRLDNARTACRHEGAKAKICSTIGWLFVYIA